MKASKEEDNNMIKRMLKSYDYSLIFAVFLLCGFGLVMVYSSSIFYYTFLKSTKDTLFIRLRISSERKVRLFQDCRSIFLSAYHASSFIRHEQHSFLHQRTKNRTAVLEQTDFSFRRDSKSYEKGIFRAF